MESKWCASLIAVHRPLPMIYDTNLSVLNVIHDGVRRTRTNCIESCKREIGVREPRLLFTKNGNQAKLHVERRYMARPSKNDRISQDSINIRASLHMY